MKMPIALACFALAGGAVLSAAEGVWLDVPFVRQQANACGAASLAMILDYWREHRAPEEKRSTPRADPEAIHRQIYVPKRKGTPADSMRRYLEAHGYRAFSFSGQWDDVRHHIGRGRPLIVALKTGSDSFHFAVVAGAGDTTVAVNDPADRKLRIYSRADFEKRWIAAGRWTLLAVPRPSSNPVPGTQRGAVADFDEGAATLALKP